MQRELQKLRSSESDFLSRFLRSLQVFEISDEDAVLIIAKEKVGSIATGECAGIVLSGRGRCQVDIVPAKLTSLKMRNDFGPRLNALCVRDFVQETLHHRHIPVCRQNARLNETFLADYLEMKLVSQTIS